jgi:hypothetical protein
MMKNLSRRAAAVAAGALVLAGGTSAVWVPSASGATGTSAATYSVTRAVPLVPQEKPHWIFDNATFDLTPAGLSVCAYEGSWAVIHFALEYACEPNDPVRDYYGLWLEVY